MLDRYIKFDPDGKFLITGIANRPIMETSFYSNGPNQQYTEEEHDLRNEMVRGVVSGQINAHTLLREYQRHRTDRVNVRIYEIILLIKLNIWSCLFTTMPRVPSRRSNVGTFDILLPGDTVCPE